MLGGQLRRRRAADSTMGRGRASDVAPVAVAVVSWNTRELLRACLDSLAAYASAGRAEVWVVDNGSGDGSAEMAASEYPWARLIAGGENIGFGAAVNLVAARSRGPWIAAANADVRLEPDALPALMEAGERHPQAGILAPRLVLPDGSSQHSVYSFPTVVFTLLFNLGLAGRFPGAADRLALEGRWDDSRERQVDWAVGAFLLLRRSAFEQIGGFDPEQWMYAEDLDLGWRARRAGWRTRYVPEAVVNHEQSASVRQLWGEDLEFRWLASTYAWMRRRRGPAVTWTVAAVNVAGAAARALLFTGWRRRRWARWARVHLRAVR